MSRNSGRGRKSTHSVVGLRKPQNKPDSYLDSVLAEDEDYLNVLAIRNELIENALDKCQESYLRIQSVKYLTHCLHKAYLDVFSTMYMHYDTVVIDPRRDLWIPEEQCEPLPEDNYAEFSVPIESTSVQEIPEVEISPYQFSPVKSETEHFAWPAGFTPPFSNVDVDQDVKKILNDILSLISEQFEDASTYQNIFASVREEEKKASLASSTSELYEDLTSEASFFTAVAESGQNFLPPIEPTRCDHTFTKVGDAPVEKTIKFALGEVKKVQNVGLPPLRLKARFKPSEWSRSYVRFGRSLGSFDRYNEASANYLKSSFKSTLSKHHDVDDTFEEAEADDVKKVKKVDIVG